MYEALAECTALGCCVPVPALFFILPMSLVGAIDECIEAILPGPVFEWGDILFNVLAVSVSVVIR